MPYNVSKGWSDVGEILGARLAGKLTREELADKMAADDMALKRKMAAEEMDIKRNKQVYDEKQDDIKNIIATGGYDPDLVLKGAKQGPSPFPLMVDKDLSKLQYNMASTVSKPPWDFEASKAYQGAKDFLNKSSKDNTGAKQSELTPEDMDMGKQIVEGRLAPSQLPGFGLNSLKARAMASALKIDPTIDFAQKELEYKSKNAYTTSINSTAQIATRQYLQSVIPNLDKVKEISDKMERSNFKFANKAALYARAEAGDPMAAEYVTAITEVADQVAKILQGGGTGSGTSDAKLKQAADLFDKGYSKQQIDAVIGTLKPMLSNRYSALTTNVRQTESGQKHSFTNGSADSKTIGGKTYVKSGTGWILQE